jgi:phage shock protein E
VTERKTARPEEHPTRYARAALKAGLTLLILLALSAVQCDLNDTTNLKPETVKKMLASEERPLLVDTRTEEEFRDGHLPGAILISQEKVEFADRFLPADKNITIIFYCRGSG